MLKPKKNQPPYVAALKLTTGEEILAKIISEEGGYHVTRPLAMVMAENPDNPQQTRVMFTPWMVAAGEEPIVIIQTHILAITKPAKDAQEQYEQATKTE